MRVGLERYNRKKYNLFLNCEIFLYKCYKYVLLWIFKNDYNCLSRKYIVFSTIMVKLCLKIECWLFFEKRDGCVIVKKMIGVDFGIQNRDFKMISKPHWIYIFFYRYISFRKDSKHALSTFHIIFFYCIWLRSYSVL